MNANEPTPKTPPAGLAGANGSATEPDDDAYQAWLESLAADCNCEDGPCAGCQQGAICDCAPNAAAERPGATTQKDIYAK